MRKGKRSNVESVPDIVHCFECIHRGSRIDKDGKILISCYMMSPDGYCSFGERRPSGMKNY